MRETSQALVPSFCWPAAPTARARSVEWERYSMDCGLPKEIARKKCLLADRAASTSIGGFPDVSGGERISLPLFTPPVSHQARVGSYPSETAGICDRDCNVAEGVHGILPPGGRCHCNGGSSPRKQMQKTISVPSKFMTRGRVGRRQRSATTRRGGVFQSKSGLQ